MECRFVTDLVRLPHHDHDGAELRRTRPRRNRACRRSGGGTCLVLTSFLALPLGMAAGAEVTDAWKQAKPLVDWRMRFETVDDASFADAADALTSRLRIGFQTGEWGNSALLAEAVWIEDIMDDYNSTTNGRTQYPVVADPADFVAVNRFALTNRSLERAALTFGRQRIVHDDARFVGNVGWRQNEQTYDAIRAQLSFPRIGADLAYANQVNRIFGPDSPAGEWGGEVILANLWHELAWGTLTGFAYLLDFDEAPAMSTNTVGVRLAGSKPLGGRSSGSYAVVLARQTDAGGNPSDYSERYYMLEGGLERGQLSAALGYEVLGGDGLASFRTPLATLHAFQGWADKYLTTPPAGIEDAYLRLGYTLGRRGPFSSVTALAVYHRFDAEHGSIRFGTELDVSLVAKTAHMTLTLKHAAYRARALFADTDKLWASLEYSF